MKAKLSGVVAALALVVSFSVGTARAIPIDLNYTVSGSPGDWLVDVSVTNNLGGTNVIYFVDIKLTTTAVTGIVNSPPDWAYTPGDNGSVTASLIVYNNPWCLAACTTSLNLGDPNLSFGIHPSQTLSGFEAIDTGSTAPTSLLWAVFAVGSGYTGPECEALCSNNPIFEGTALVNSTPLPAALPLFASGLGALGLLGWRRKQKAQAVA